MTAVLKDDWRKHGSTSFLPKNKIKGMLVLLQAISDLLKPERTNLTIREDRRRGNYVEGLSEWVVRSASEVGHPSCLLGWKRTVLPCKLDPVLLASLSVTLLSSHKGNPVAKNFEDYGYPSLSAGSSGHLKE